MPDDEMIARLLGTLYTAPVQPELWRSFLQQLSKVCGISKAALIAHNLPERDHRMLATLGDSVGADLQPEMRERGNFHRLRKSAVKLSIREGSHFHFSGTGWWQPIDSKYLELS